MLSRHSDASALLRHLQRYDARSVRILRLTGCLMAAPEKVFQAVSVCVHLAELYCVNCIVSPRRLFDILTTVMSSLIRLEWSLFKEETYEERFDDIGASETHVVPTLQHMYVEVDDDFASCNLLKRFQRRCVNLKHLHVHALHGDNFQALAACWCLNDSLCMLESFAYSGQGFSENVDWFLVTALHSHVQLPALWMISAVFGNVTYRMHPVVSCTRVLLKDVIASEELAVPEEEVVFCAECVRNELTQLAEIADRSWLQRLRSLTFVLLTPSDHLNAGLRRDYVSPACSSPLNRILRLTGCLKAAPEKVFQAVSVCVNLAELYCVNCILSPRRLLGILTTSMLRLIRLEWSLFDEQTYGERFEEIGASENDVVPKLRHMYVEVEYDSASCELLKRIQKRCVSLEHLTSTHSTQTYVTR
ncbi:hypothetical protein V5799_019812 [Amblyomma americanum]|uniref:Uncharacterized protein n=1 Tax=Amblyomma americanum TaxID=6943 RepID=A0AAQ4EVU5_AMBAM